MRFLADENVSRRDRAANMLGYSAYCSGSRPDFKIFQNLAQLAQRRIDSRA
jgi:hypothetical protein